ncbi:MAG: hypothetical protein IJO14_11810 [Clostridia bacterium]|nr:hypothetical protein [Clostridia bacterium]
MKKVCLLAVTVLALLPMLAAEVFAAGLHVSAGMRNYPLIIGCVVGGSLVVFLLAMFAMKFKRKPADEEIVEEDEDE